jgi:hypothetical protein
LGHDSRFNRERRADQHWRAGRRITTTVSISCGDMPLKTAPRAIDEHSGSALAANRSVFKPVRRWSDRFGIKVADGALSAIGIRCH